MTKLKTGYKGEKMDKLGANDVLTWPIEVSFIEMTILRNKAIYILTDH